MFVFEQKIELVKQLLDCKLPGISAQQKMAPSMRTLNFKFSFNKEKARKSAVLILLYPKNGDIYTVFIKRAVDNYSHSGQVSLPGGKFESEDKILENTALRECQEEIGVNSSDVKIIRGLTLLHIPVSNFYVYPFVAYTSSIPVFIPDINEVQYVIETPVKNLYNPENIKTKTISKGNYSVLAPYYDINDNHIWGATAMIISEFVELLNSKK